MAVLTDSDRIECAAEFMRELSNIRESLNLTKPDVRAAVSALDQFLSDNAAAVNAAIPLPARTNLTTAQKARMLTFVIRQRYLKGA